MKNHLAWTAPEFEYYRKDKNWLTVASLIAAALFLWALLTKNFIFALLIALSYFVTVSYAFRKPAQVKLTITPKGVKVNRTLYEFDNLKSFWIFYQPPQVREISLRSKKTVMPYVKLPLGEQNPVEVRKILLKYLPERRHKESLVDNLARSLKF